MSLFSYSSCFGTPICSDVVVLGIHNGGRLIVSLMQETCNAVRVTKRPQEVHHAEVVVLVDRLSCFRWLVGNLGVLMIANGHL